MKTVKTRETQVDEITLLAMVDEIAKPTASSNPYDYIEAHRDIYDNLVAGGKDTAAVFIEILINSDEFGLDKYIMAAVCAEITGIGSGSNKTWSSAKDWLQLYESAIDKPEDETMDSTQGIQTKTTISGTEDGVRDFMILHGEFKSPYETDRCFNITPLFIKENTEYSIFKYDQSCASFLLYNGEIYLMGEWFGGYGVTDMKLADMNRDGRQELFFTFSWGSGIHRSQVGYFDPATSQVCLVDYSHMNGDMMLVDNQSGGLSIHHAAISHMDDFVNFSIEAADCLSDLVFMDGLVKLATIPSE